MTLPIARYMLVYTGPYFSQIGSDQRDQGIYAIREACWTYLTALYDPSTQASVHAPLCLRAQAHISAKLGQIREIKVSMKSGEHAGPL